MPQKKKQKKGFKTAPATAPSQTLGYGLQYTRLTAILLTAPAGYWCSLEVLDDVAAQAKCGMTILSQTKSALGANPVADHAIPLWKTLFNWLELVKSGLIEPGNTIFELYVSRPVEGEIINSFHDSHTIAEAKAAIEKVRNKFWGTAPNYIKRASLAEGLGLYVNQVLNADNDHLLPIIINLRLTCGSGSPQSDIEDEIRRHPVSKEKIFDIADKLCGWVKRNIDKRLEQSLPAIISRDEFHIEYTSYVRKVDRDHILTSFAKKPSEAEKFERFPDIFVQQLDLIEHSYDDKLEAISDFLQASWDRVMWSKSGEIHDDSFTELTDNLERAWKNLRQAINVEAESTPETKRGKLLYAKCMLHNTWIQGMEPPPHFVAGCFHALADDLTVGWHPAYRTLLKNSTSEPQCES
ncbi:MAG: hypothetical protein MRJ67_00235 [Nitrospirales bacterium]|nr:hypothetical protein [Nitrospirales bacterium]